MGIFWAAASALSSTDAADDSSDSEMEDTTRKWPLPFYTFVNLVESRSDFIVFLKFIRNALSMSVDSEYYYCLIRVHLKKNLYLVVLQIFTRDYLIKLLFSQKYFS